MFTKMVFAVPAAALTLMTLVASTVSTSNSAEAGAWTNSCRGSGCYRQPGGPPLAPKPDRPNQPKK